MPDLREAVHALERYKGNVMRSWSPRELVAPVADKKPDFAAGTSFRCSNTGYVLAGLMIERVTGHRLGRELCSVVSSSRRTCATCPFRLNASGVAGSPRERLRRPRRQAARRHRAQPVGRLGSRQSLSTAGDIAHFWLALLGGKLLAPRS